ncbi:MAG: cysteine synthase B, partial [Actinomycetota bacterium]
DLVYGLRSLDEGFIPEIYDETVIDRKVKVNSSDSVMWTQQLLRQEGIFAGISSGATVHVARRIAAGIESGEVVCLFADGGWKYLSTEIWTKEVEEAARGVEYMPW